MTEENKILQIIRKQSPQSYEYEKENKFYDEFIEMFNSVNESTVSFSEKISTFVPANDIYYKAEHLPLAAQSQTMSTQKEKYYIIEDKNAALCINVKNVNQVFISLITEAAEEFENVLIYCNETGKYFIPDFNKEFYFGSFDNFSTDYFNFSLVEPMAKILLSCNDYTIADMSKEMIVESLYREEKTEILLKVKNNILFKNAVIKSNNHRDFIRYSDNIIYLPEVLLNKKVEIFLY